MSGTATGQANGQAKPETPNIKVLMYHRVVDGPGSRRDDARYSIDVKVFEKHLQLLERMGFTPIRFLDYELFLMGRLRLPRRPIIITFDDGYLDTYELAVPLLRRHGMHAVIFVVTDPGLRRNEWDAGKQLTLAPLMSPSQILELHAAGFEIGSHSLTHPGLTLVPQEKAWEEISRSRILLEILINSTVRTFSYPFGLLNEKIRTMAMDAGYSFACGVYSGPPTFGADHFNIRRIAPSSDPNTFRFFLEMAVPYEKITWLGWSAKQWLIRGARNLRRQKAGSR